MDIVKVKYKIIKFMICKMIVRHRLRCLIKKVKDGKIIIAINSKIYNIIKGKYNFYKRLLIQYNMELVTMEVLNQKYKIIKYLSNIIIN